jgi:uncharacterized zinc-type alcohol dehydrogenase-like protein
MESVSKTTNPYDFRGKILEDDSTDADGVAWAVMEKGAPMKKVFIKHPELGKREIRIKVCYSGICQSDVTYILQKFPMGVFPMIAGHEIVGKVYSKGSEVNNVEIGDTVGVGPIRECCENCDYCYKGKENLCEGIPSKLTISPWFGGFATSIQVPSNYVFKIPEGIPMDLTPPLMCAGATIFAPIKKYGKVGCKVAIIGIGGLGHLGVQFASKAGMKTYAVSTSGSKKDDILKLGAHEVVVSTDPEQFKKFLGEKIDLMINTTSSGDIEKYMRALRKGTGVFVQVGGPEEVPKINLIEILLNEWSLAGSAASNREDVKTMLEFAQLNGVKSMNEIYSFEEFPKAFDKVANGKPNFRVVVDVQSYNNSIEK